MLRTSRTVLQSTRLVGRRCMASSPEVLAELKKCSSQAVVDALWVMGYPQNQIEGARPLAKGMKCVGNAVTVRFVPHRPDILADKPIGVNSPEYVAFELCGPNEVLVMSSTGPWESVGGDIKFLRLMQRDIAGLVTDGSVRDTDEIISYGFPVWSHSTTAKQGPAVMQPWACNDVITCGGVSVRPGDAILADQDGAVVVPESLVKEVIRVAEEREEVEMIIKEELRTNPGPPGKYYPFKQPINPESPLAKLLEVKKPSVLPRLTAGFVAAPKRAFSTSARGTHPASTSARSFSTAVAPVPKTMRAAVIRETGSADVIQVEEDVPVPSELADGQVLVQNAFAGLNFIDTYHRSGMYARELPFIGGQEGAGVVAVVTPKASAMGIKQGDRVAYSSFFSYAEYTAVPAAKLLPVPESVPLDVATALVVQGMTAHYLTSSAHAQLIKEGEWCLIHGVGGGTCQWAAQMAKIRGFKVIGTVSKGKEHVASGLGCDELIVLDEVAGTSYEDYTSVDVAAKVLEMTGGKGVQCVIDGIGKNTWELSLASLAQRGICIFFGNASGAVPPVNPLKLIGKSNFIPRPKLLDYTRDREELLWRSSEVFGWVADGSLKVNVDKVFPLSETGQGHKYLEEGKSTGKVLYDCATLAK
mmetsp:Transcript_28057/g.50971  ORF Transcript_28057/g.50971 Transcript_28057/m.50971 type:complete len:643 (-) Transcript_28057:240-2168(-)